jgi:hypothetical protein
MTVLGHAAVDRDLGLFEKLSSGGFNVNCPGVNLINWYRNNGGCFVLVFNASMRNYKFVK